MRKCVYCDAELQDNRSMEICDRCGVGVWGHKQWLNIKKTTDEARDNGDLSLFKEQDENREESPVKWRDLAEKKAV